MVHVASSQPVSAKSRVHATSYVNFGHSVLVAVASWATVPVTVTLKYDFESLGFEGAQVETPAIEGLQKKEDQRTPEEAFTLEAGAGAIFMVSPQGIALV